MGEITRSQIVAAARRAAEENGGVLSLALLETATGIKRQQVEQAFPRAKFRQLARLIKSKRGSRRYPDEALLAEYHRVAIKLGRIPSWIDMDKHAKICSMTYRNRFGGRKGVTERYQIWLQDTPKARLPAPLEQLRNRRTPKPSLPRPFLVGDPIDFRALRHTPTNESGVVLLFGMVAQELGFTIDGVHTAFPDCTAKQLVDRKARRWRTRLIEFEFHSSNFLLHGHDPRGCDLIVCWAHDWPECPLEVLELRSAIVDLAASASQADQKNAGIRKLTPAARGPSRGNGPHRPAGPTRRAA